MILQDLTPITCTLGKGFKAFSLKIFDNTLGAERRFIMQAVKNEELKIIIKESVKEALEEELTKLRLMFFPEISDKEMLDIINRYEKPAKKSAYTEHIDI